MRLSAIVAMSQNQVMGRENKLPWHLPADLIHFKKITWGKPILMGRKTYESIGRPLPGRLNVVISREKNYNEPGIVAVDSIEAALHLVKDSEEVFVIGGAVLFQQLLPYTQRLYLTLIHEDFDGDVFFPQLKLSEWQEIENVDYEPDDKNHYHYSFKIWERI